MNVWMYVCVNDCMNVSMCLWMNNCMNVYKYMNSCIYVYVDVYECDLMMVCVCNIIPYMNVYMDMYVSINMDNSLYECTYVSNLMDVYV